MKVIKTMDASGDTRIEFTETDEKATAEARELFERLTSKGAAVFAVNRAGAPDKRVRDFSELEAENVVVPRIVGG